MGLFGGICGGLGGGFYSTLAHHYSEWLTGLVVFVAIAALCGFLMCVLGRYTPIETNSGK